MHGEAEKETPGRAEGAAGFDKARRMAYNEKNHPMKNRRKNEKNS